ncbi:MAG TPA: hypothetical protein PKK48_08995, partial [Phycisphaerae bacterium]|nr:hypothetical protein [Phycisphaerae bacterium]
NKNQLNVFGDGAIISGSWASANTGIITHIKKIKKASKKLTGYEIGCAFYGASIIDYFLANTQVTKLIANNSATQLVLQGGEIPDGFLGIKKWYPMDSSFYEDDDGTIQEIWGDDNITFTPTPSLEWFGFLEGSYPVPKTLDIVKDAAAALDNTMQVYGQFSYATLQDDPVSAKQVAGDTFLPVLKVPKAVFQAKVANF